MSEYSGLFKILKVKPKTFFRILEDEKRYSAFKINKKGGGQRELLAPSLKLCILQKRFLRKLEDSYEPTRAAHGFTQEKSILTNASLHVGKQWILNVDVKDFFPSINDRRVYGSLTHWKKFRERWDLSKKEIYFLAQLCCFEEKLPQGAPTSPFISNLVARKLDKQMLKFSYENKLCYTRYCDDITLSPVHSKVEPNCLVFPKSGRLKKEFNSIFIDNGFTLNPKKTRLQTSPRPLRVTGLVVNSTANIPRKWIRQVRAMLADVENIGYENAQRKYIEECKKRGRCLPLFRVLWGKIQYISMIRGKGDPVYLKLRKKYLSFYPYESITLKVDLDDFPRRPDIDSIINEDLKYENSNKGITTSYLKSWVETRIDFLVGDIDSLRKDYQKGIYEIVYIAEKAFLLSQIKPASSQREIFTHYKTAWDRLVSKIGDEYGKQFSKLPKELESKNKDLKKKLKAFWESQGIPFKMKGRKGEFLSIWESSGDPQQRGQGLAALVVFLALAYVEGEEVSILRQKKRFKKALDVDPDFVKKFYKLRNIRNIDKRRNPNFKDFREGFYRAWKTFGMKLR